MIAGLIALAFSALVQAVMNMLPTLRPGTQILVRETPPPRSAPTDTSVWFVTGLSDKGPLTPQMIFSMADFERIFGLKQSYSVLYDSLDVYFREGGRSAWVSRVVGPAATVGTKNLLDAGAGVSLIVSALGPGAYSANIKVGVVAGSQGGTFQIQVTDQNNVVLEQSPDLANQQAAILWGQNSQYITIALGATALNPAVVAAGALSAGNDDRASIVEANWQTAQDRFAKDLGPGQVSSPGNTTDARHLSLLQHALDKRRTAILDAPDTPTEATLKTSTAAKRTGNQRWGGMFGPWVIYPGITPGTFRTIPPSALVAGCIARNDLVLGPNDASAGDSGQSRAAVDLSQVNWDDATRDRLNSAGLNVIIRKYGGIRVYGWRTLVDPNADPYWINLGNARLYMAIAADGDVIAEQFVFDQIDGQGRKQNEFGGALAGMLQGYYTEGALYGETPADAFAVDVGDQVNTPQRIAANELRAVLAVRMSPMAELVTIEIVKTPVTEALA